VTLCARFDLFVTPQDPERSKIAFIVNIYVISLILLSAVVTVVETIPAFHHPDSTPFWFALECIFVSNFTLEYLLRQRRHMGHGSCVQNTPGATYTRTHICSAPARPDLACGCAGGSAAQNRMNSPPIH